jgi:outer membrane biosynthesis protein TonB
VSRNTSRDWYAGRAVHGSGRPDGALGATGRRKPRRTPTRLPDRAVYQEHRGQRRPTPLAAGLTREAREGAAECTTTHYTRPSGSSPRLQAVRVIPASNETMRGVVAFDDPLEEQVGTYPGLPRDRREDKPSKTKQPKPQQPKPRPPKSPKQNQIPSEYKTTEPPNTKQENDSKNSTPKPSSTFSLLPTPLGIKTAITRDSSTTTTNLKPLRKNFTNLYASDTNLISTTFERDFSKHE